MVIAFTLVLSWLSVEVLDKKLRNLRAKLKKA